jgi:serine/threonine protein kinase
MPATNALLQEGRYRITNESSNEGGGSVYDAYDTVSETNVIVREITVKRDRVQTVSQRESQNVALADRARVLAEIKHESLLHVRDYFSETGRQYIVVDPIEGDDLKVLLDRQGNHFPISDVTGWADQLLDALHYLHSFRTPIIHREIRPENVRLNPDGKVMLVTFGLVGDGRQDKAVVNANGPDAVEIAYSPLEQIWNGLDAASQKVIVSRYDERSERILKEDLDARSDIYSLGATLYHLATARPPVDSLERSIEILEGRPDPLASPNNIDPSIPSEISDVIVKAMEIKREYRFDSAAIMRQVLRTALVRVKERETGEVFKPQNVYTDTGFSERRKQPVVVPEERRESERYKQQLQEAEAQRQSAERRAIEAEKKLSESEAALLAQHDDPTVANFDDDLLGVLGPAVHVSDGVNAKTGPDDFSLSELIDEVEREYAAVDKQDTPSSETVGAADESEADDLVEAQLEGSATEDSPFSNDVPVEVEAVESPADEVSLFALESAEEAQPAEFAAEVPNPIDKFNKPNLNGLGEKPPAETERQLTQSAAKTTISAKETRTESIPMQGVDEMYIVAVEPAGFRFGIPAIGIAAGVIIAIAIGVWTMMSSGTSEPATVSPTVVPAANQAPPSEPEVKSAFQPTDLPAVEPSNSAMTVQSDETPATKTESKATPKPKKPTPAKAPAQKKAVTVDDLINDN